MKWIFLVFYSFSFSLYSAYFEDRELPFFEDFFEDSEFEQEEEFEPEEIENEEDEIAQENWGDLREIIAQESEETEEIRPRRFKTPQSCSVEELWRNYADSANKNVVQPLQKNTKKALQSVDLSFKAIFRGSPIIYLLLFSLSIFSVSIWLYSMFTVRSIELLPPTLIKELRTKLIHNQFNDALDLCVREKHFFCKMLASAILMRKHGLHTMIDSMKAEGRRSTTSFWQRISLLNDVAIIAPLFGLLGTVLGMFQGFHDLSRSAEGITLLFNNLSTSIGTTVAGLAVAILSIVLHSTARYRLIRILTNVENEAQTFASLIDTRAPNYLEG